MATSSTGPTGKRPRRWLDLAVAYPLRLLLLASPLILAPSILGQGGGLTGPPSLVPGPARRPPPPGEGIVTPLPPIPRPPQ